MQNVRWKIPFVSLLDRHYEVHIYDQNYSGDPVVLTGAPVPFETNEDSNDEYFTPIRTQSGYIRIIDTEGLIETLIPKNNTERLVRLVELADVQITRWQGFLRAEAYTQEWTDNAKMIELPVHSILSALNDVVIPSNFVGNIKRIASLVYQAFSALGTNTVGTNVLIDSIYINDGTSGIAQSFLCNKIQHGIFFDMVTFHNEGETKVSFEGNTFYDILYNICLFYGLCLREQGRNLCFAAYDAMGEKSSFIKLAWNDIATLNNGGIPSGSTVEFAHEDVLSALRFFGTENLVSYRQGAKSVTIAASIGDEDVDIFTIPQATEDASAIYTVDKVSNTTVKIQPHEPRNGTVESFIYYEVQSFSGSTSDTYPRLIGSSNYDKCLNNCVIKNPIFDPLNISHPSVHTGAFPVRWFQQKGSDEEKLNNGIFFNVYYMLHDYQYQPRRCYTLRTQSPFTLKDGYLVIDSSIKIFIPNFSHPNEAIVFNPNPVAPYYAYETQLFTLIKFGDKYWDGNSKQWVKNSGTVNPFRFHYDKGTIRTNKPKETTIDKNSGYFIPVNGEMSGTISIEFYNIAYTQMMTANDDTNMHSFIMDTLDITFWTSADIVTSDRSSNSYYKQIVSSGFSEKLDISLPMATMNNNRRGQALLMDDSSDYITARVYADSRFGSSLRPEMYLLNRIAEYYSIARIILESETDLTQNTTLRLLTYNGKLLMPICKNINWRDDLQSTKLIECKKI